MILPETNFLITGGVKGGIVVKRDYRVDPILAAIAEGQTLPYETVDVKTRWISDGLKEELESWDYSKPGALGPVLINAPTGSGKSTFVMNDLAQHVKKYRRYVLLLSNRSALELQQKYTLSRKVGGADWSGLTLSEMTRIDNVLVFTYQSVCQALEYGGLASRFPIGAVVFDEAHFFSSDATFNPRTKYIFDIILKYCWRSQRIYMSATPDDVRDLIAYEEYQVKRWINTDTSTAAFASRMRGKYSAIKEYRVAPDYSYIQLHFFDEWETIKDRIKGTESDDKWLIFVSGKDQGKELKKQLGEDAVFIDALSKEKNQQKFSDLARRELFNQKVLISTCVLDNGVNFHDPKLRTVVIDSADYVEVKQMLGRKRAEEGEIVNVYIMTKSLKDIDFMRRNLANYYQMVQEFRDNPIHFIQCRWGSLTESQQQMFEPINGKIMPDGSPIPGGLLVSDYALFQLDRQIRRLEQLSDRIAREGDTAFVNEVSGWFGEKLPSEVIIEESLHEEVKKKVDSLYAHYLELSPLAKEVMQEFEGKVWDAVKPLKTNGPKLRRGESRENANIKAAAKFFSLPYECSKENNMWILKLTEEETN